VKRGVVESLGNKGDGLLRIDDENHHVSKVLPGETIVLHEGRLHAIEVSSPERIEAFCAHYARCGGCKLQHWQDAPYRAWKRQLLVDALSSKGIETKVADLVDAHGAGRRRVSLHVRKQNGAWVAGFMEQKSHDLVALDHCPVLVPSMRDVAKLAAAFGEPLGACDVAVTAADNGLDVAIKAERKIVMKRIEALNTILKNFAVLRLSVNGDVHTSLHDPFVMMGRAGVKLPVQNFLQPTRAGEEALAQLVLAGVGKAKSIADLFCGLGPFALRLAETSRVTAIDSDKQAVVGLLGAVRNTQGLKPVEAQARDLFREPLMPAELHGFEAVVLDPPRAGAEAQVKMIAKSTVKRVVMVACDVSTFARDAAILKTGGFALKEATPVDQFKWTAHLEMVGVFTR
jgi:23S rRNA (uracil1939-C5)-methyltransferase